MPTRRGLVAFVAAGAMPAMGACVATGASEAPGPVAFDTTTAWVVDGSDSARVLVEVARTERQQSVGLAGRPSLDPGSGMLFLFDELRTEQDGFWMWRTEIPLDIAFIDPFGTITQVLSMRPCEDSSEEQDCPGYFPDGPYASALEVGAGWFAERGLGEGAVVRVTR